MAAAPKFDVVTEITMDWCGRAMDGISEFIAILDLYDSEAVQGNVIQALSETPKPSWFVHYDHGSPYVMWGDDEKPIIDLGNLHKLAGMHIYCMNCSSGKGLGAHAVDKGVLEYWGYNDVVRFTTDAIDEFGEALNYGLVKAITEGLFLRDVVEETRDHGYQVADKIRVQGKILGAACMVMDMSILHVYYEGGPEPPDPECWVSRCLKKLFGWNGLWFFRMLRQQFFGAGSPVGQRTSTT